MPENTKRHLQALSYRSNDFLDELDIDETRPGSPNLTPKKSMVEKFCSENLKIVFKNIYLGF